MQYNTDRLVSAEFAALPTRMTREVLLCGDGSVQWTICGTSDICVWRDSYIHSDNSYTEEKTHFNG